MTKKHGTRLFWKTSEGIVGLLVLLAILFAVNVLVGNLRLRADLTAQKLYTLSAGTKAQLKKLEQPVTLKFFFSSSAAEVPMYLKNYARQVQDLLQEYRIASGGKVTVELYDPKPDSDAEEWAQRYGVTGQSAGLMAPPVFCGLVAVSGKTEGALPFLDPRAEGLLEYSITRLIYRTVKPDKPRVGVLSSLPVMGSGASPFGMMPGAPRQPPWMAFRDLREDYKVESLPPTAESIDKDLRTLILVHPKDLSEKTLYAIDQFVLRGGHLMVFLDPFCAAEMESQPQQPFGRAETSSNLAALLNAWGVGYDPGKVVADPRAMTRLRNGNGQVEDVLVFLSLAKDAVSKDDILTSELDSLMVPFGGSFTDQTQGSLTFAPLVKASPMAGVVDAMTAQFGGQAIRRDLKPSATPPVLAVRLSGKFKTAFAQGEPKDGADAEGDKENKDQEKKDNGSHFTEGESTVLLFADADMLADRFCVEELNFFGSKAYRPLNNNLALFANAIEQLSGSSDLIGIRSRGSFDRPFHRVAELEQKAGSEWQAREQDLEAKLQETRQQLSQLQTQKDQSQKFILSAEQKEALERFRAEELRINRELKEVRKSLRRDIETLGVKVKFVNIALMPILVCLAGIGFGLYRRGR